MALHRSRNQLRLFKPVLNLGLLICGLPNIQMGMLIAGLLDPERRIPVSGFVVLVGRYVPGDIDREELAFPVLFIMLVYLLGRKSRCGPPASAVTGPDRCYPNGLPIGPGAEPHRAVSRFTESLDCREELPQGHRLTKSEPFMK